MEDITVRSVDGVRLDTALHPASSSTGRGVVLLVHGITVDMDEGGGMFIRLAEQLDAAGFNVVRFSFRGHGNSGGTPRGVTVAGECLDLQAAVEAVRERFPGPLSIVAASFGAVSTTLSLPWLESTLHRLVLWNPVLDLRRTFVEPEWPGERRTSARSSRKTSQSTDGLSSMANSSLAECCSTSSRTIGPSICSSKAQCHP
ncbi:alpha/beta hydrolase [Nocardia gipuzkoensis]